MEKKNKYVGDAKNITTTNGTFMKLQLNLTQLFGYTKNDEEVITALRKWQSKDGTENTCINIVIAEMKPENQTEYKTHSAKIDTWKPTAKTETAPPRESVEPPF